MCGFAGFVGEVDDREQVLVNMILEKVLPMTVRLMKKRW